MVQGGLLTAHPGDVHGYGWSPVGGSSSRQGAGAASPGNPDLETATARYRGEFAEKRSILGVSTPRAKYRRRGAPRGPTRQPGGLLARPRVGPCQDPPGLLVVAPLPFLDYSGSFRGADSLSVFSRIFGALLMAEKPEIQKQQKTGTCNWVH